MKRLLSLMAIILLSGIYAATGISSSLPGGPSAVVTAKKVEVYYFHFTRRCTTCNNVEKVSKAAVETQFPDQVKSGEMFFKSVNLEEKDGEALGARLKIEGQTLIIICGSKSVNLTDKGFLYANESPDKLKAEIKKAIIDVQK
ncbi:MAG: nitrophenyl compound nitroreductase subunit ArsF family protein [Bacteroidota bacterium]